jgi:hypothetical protein
MVGNRSEAKPFILTAVLVIAAAVIFFIARQFPNTSIWIGIVLYLLIDIGFLFSIFLGIKTRKKQSLFSV